MPIAVLVPVSTSAAGSWAPVGAATIHEAIDDPFGSCDQTLTEAAASGTTQFRCVLSTLPDDVLSINSATLHWFGRGDLAGVGQTLRVALELSAVEYDDGFHAVDGVGGGYLAFSVQHIEHPDLTSGPLTPAHFSGAAVVGDFSDATGPVDGAAISQIVVVVDYVGVPQRLGATRFQSSTELNLFRMAQTVIQVPSPERFADVPILGEIDLTHIALPSTETERGREPWQRTNAIKLRETVNLNNPASPLILTLLVMRWVRVTFWDTMETELAPSAFMDGVARLDSGVERTFARASDVYVENPAAAVQGSIQVVKLGDDHEAICTGGTLFEQASTNNWVRSSFIGNVETGWTSAGEGSNGSAIALSTEELLFHPDITPTTMKFTAGNPIHVADLSATGTASAAIADSTVCCASFDHLDLDDAAPLYYQVIRDSGGVVRYWRDSDSTWQAGATWNAMTGSESWHRHATKPMDIGVNAPDATLQARVGIPTATGVAGQINYLAHAQLEQLPYPTSRIPTITTTETRVATDSRMTNDHGKRIFSAEPEEPMTGFFEFQAEWNDTDLPASAVREFWRAHFQAADLARVFYNEATARLVFRYRAAGVNNSAEFDTAIVRGQWYKVAWRKVSTAAEYGNATHTISIWVDGVKGTDDTGVGPMGAAPAETTFYMGHDNTPTNHADAIMRRFRIIPVALSDDEIVGYMEA